MPAGSPIAAAIAIRGKIRQRDDHGRQCRHCFGRWRCAPRSAAGFDGFAPDACLINRYEPETKLSLHRDEDERDLAAPVVSVSLGLPAIFLWGGLSRKDRPSRIRLESGDVVVWGGPARLVYHGVAPLAEGEHPLTGHSRINLTFRKALVSSRRF